jgi:hypothetical protein
LGKHSKQAEGARSPMAARAKGREPYAEWFFLNADELERLRKLDPEIIH